MSELPQLLYLLGFIIMELYRLIRLSKWNYDDIFVFNLMDYLLMISALLG